MSANERKASRFPCHIYDIADAKEAHNSFRGELVKEYGDNVSLKNGKVLHWNYMWDDGSRSLVRCRDCGGLLIKQDSEIHSFTDAPDGFFQDWIPVASEEEADLLNILLTNLEMESVPCRHLRGNNRYFFWTKNKEPEPHDPEELIRRIREKYPDAASELLEDYTQRGDKGTAGSAAE